MIEEKGLTGVWEIMRGFVGFRGLSDKPANNGRKRVRFDIVAGNTDAKKLEYPIWRHCVAYDDVAVALSGLKPKDYLKIEGYLLPEIIRDRKTGKPVFLPDGEPAMNNIFMVQKFERLKHQSRQYSMFQGMPSGASDMVGDSGI